jgi:fucose permease
LLPPVSAPTHGWTQAALIYAGAVLIGINLVAVPSSSAYLKALHGLTDQQYGSVFLPQLVMAITGALAAGPAVKRLSLKTMYIVALVLLCLSLTALALSAYTADFALPLLMVSTGLFGLGFGFGGGPLNGLVCQEFPDRMDSALTALHMLAGAGLMLGPLYFGAMQATGYWLLGPVVAALAAAALLTAVALLVSSDRPRLASASADDEPAASSYFWIMIALALLYGCVEATFSNWAVIFAREARGLDSASVAATLSGFWAGLTVGRFLATVMLGHFKATPLWFAMPILMFAALSLTPYSSGSAQVIAVFVFGGLACSAFFPLLVSVASRPFPHAVSWIASMLTASLMCGVGIVSYLIGYLLQEMTIESVYSLAAIFPVLMLVLMVLRRR